MSRASDLAASVGQPLERWEALKARVQDENLKRFADVADDWLALIWSLDAHRSAGVAPAGLGKPTATEAKRLAAAYRGKGNWFATLVSLLLENQTNHRLAPRVRVQGFSQTHQIDVAWPDRKVDPLVCLETKVTGAPPTKSDPARKATGDWSNRRKELKFAATDLKLFRRQHLTTIDHWDVWRAGIVPKTYFVWAARLSPKDNLAKMVTECDALVKTYLEGAGIVAWRERDGTEGYEIVALPPSDRVQSVDDVLYRIASEIKAIAPPGTPVPEPELPDKWALDDPDELEEDQNAD